MVEKKSYFMEKIASKLVSGLAICRINAIANSSRCEESGIYTVISSKIVSFVLLTVAIEKISAFR